MNGIDPNRPATRADICEIREILERERNVLIKAVILQVTLIVAIGFAQWLGFMFLLQRLKLL